MAAKDKGIGKPKKDPVMDLTRKITDRYRVTAREARDIVTAVSNAAKQMKPVNPKDFDRDLQPNPNRRINAIKDIGTQVSETARAARTGQKGTSAYTGKQRGTAEQIRRVLKKAPQVNLDQAVLDRAKKKKK